MSKTEHDITTRALSGSEIDMVAGGLASFELTIEGQSALDVLTHWKNGIVAEQVSSYTSISAGRFSIGLEI